MDLYSKLMYYTQCLVNDYPTLTGVQESFLDVAKVSVINVIDSLQHESYLKYNVFSTSELNLIRSNCYLDFFNKENRVNRVLNPLKKAFRRGGLEEAMVAIQYMKNLQLYSFTTLDNQLLDILEHMTCMAISSSEIRWVDWILVFDILFRGTNVKLSIQSNEISFYCQSQNILGEQERIELSACVGSGFQNPSIVQSKWIIRHQSIASTLFQKIRPTGTFYPIGIHIQGSNGYLFSVQHKGVYVASKVSENPIFIPQNEQEYGKFLENHVLDILCHLKKHYTELAKVIRRTTMHENMWMINDIKF